MELREKVLYHQIHPLKLLTDWATAFAAVLLLWHRRLPAALALGLVPPVLVTAALLRWGGLQRYKDSSFGRYVARYMTPATQLARLCGLAFLWGGAWLHRPSVMLLGLGIILLAWARGRLWPHPSSDAAA